MSKTEKWRIAIFFVNFLKFWIFFLGKKKIIFAVKSQYEWRNNFYFGSEKKKENERRN